MESWSWSWSWGHRHNHLSFTHPHAQLAEQQTGAEIVADSTDFAPDDDGQADAVTSVLHSQKRVGIC